MEENRTTEQRATMSSCSHLSDALAENTAVGEYRIVREISRSGAAITYLAQDSIIGDTVQILEFFPSKMARRSEQGELVEPLPGAATKYKYFRASFMDLYRTLSQEKENECLLPIVQILEQNATVYVVIEYRSMVTLEEHLQGGRECWCQAKKYLLPLYNSLSLLHKKGMIHQGISPQNILLDEQLNPYWSGFSLSEMRTAQGELEPELFSGYSAPEQYQLESWQGTWTDVYSMAAVTYRVLTGAAPPAACSRKQQDTLIPPYEVDEDIPENISQALMKAMELEIEERYDSIDQLIRAMLETVSSNTAIFSVEGKKGGFHSAADSHTAVFQVENTDTPNTVHLDHSEPEPPSHGMLSGNRIYVVVTMLATLLVLVAGAPRLYRYLNESWAAFSNEGSESENQEESEQTTLQPTEQDEGHKVENFIGKQASAVAADAKYEPWFRFELVERYSEEFKQGIVVEQSIAAGTMIERKTGMTLYVSKGSASEPLPYLVGKTAEEAAAVLTEMGKQSKIVNGESDAVEAGKVFRTEPPAGTKLYKDQSETVILYVAADKKASDESDATAQTSGQKNTDRKVIKKKSSS